MTGNSSGLSFHRIAVHDKIQNMSGVLLKLAEGDAVELAESFKQRSVRLFPARSFTARHQHIDSRPDPVSLVFDIREFGRL